MCIRDSFYDNYRGAICFVRIVSGTVRAGMTIRMMNTGAKFDVVEVGVRSPGYEPVDALRAGDVGYIAASIKDLHDTRAVSYTHLDVYKRQDVGYRKRYYEDNKEDALIMYRDFVYPEAGENEA